MRLNGAENSILRTIKSEMMRASIYLGKVMDVEPALIFTCRPDGAPSQVSTAYYLALWFTAKMPMSEGTGLTLHELFDFMWPDQFSRQEWHEERLRQRLAKQKNARELLENYRQWRALL